MKLRMAILLMMVAYLILTGCESVKPYQRMYVNDYEMKPGQAGSRRFEEQVQAYREGASGGGSSKSSGGCGCN